MRLHLILTAVALVLLVSVSPVRAQGTPDPSGHWTGYILIPGGDAEFEVDIARDESGTLIGTITGSDVRNVPLTKVALNGRSVSFEARSDQPFDGELANDGKTISGQTSVSGYDLSFSLTRTGDATIEPRPTSPPIGKELEGTWHGVIDAPAMQLRVTLTMMNRTAGRATGTMTSVDEGGLTLPLVITQHGATVELEQRGMPGLYSLRLNADRTELVGTLTERGHSFSVRVIREH